MPSLLRRRFLGSDGQVSQRYAGRMPGPGRRRGLSYWAALKWTWPRQSIRQLLLASALQGNRVVVKMLAARPDDPLQSGGGCGHLCIGLVTTDALHPLDGDEQVQDAIIRYVGGIDNEGPHNGGPWQDVVWTALIQAARSVPGVQDVAITVGTAPNPTRTVNLGIGDRQVAETTPDKVVSH